MQYCINAIYNAVVPPCKVPLYCYHGGSGKNQELLTSLTTAQGYCFAVTSNILIDIANCIL